MTGSSTGKEKSMSLNIRLMFPKGMEPPPSLNQLESVPFNALYKVLSELSFINDGDCRYVASAVMVDLYGAGVKGDLRYVRGIDKKGNPHRRRPPNWEHFWVELDGWVLDASNTVRQNGNERNLVISHAPMYYRAMGLKVTSRKKPKQFERKLWKGE